MSSSITNTPDGKFRVQYAYGKLGGINTFDTFDEANLYLITLEEQYMPDYDNDEHKEPAASDLTPEQAVEINSDIRVPSGDYDQAPLPGKDDVGSGNTEAPHVTDKKEHDDQGKAK